MNQTKGDYKLSSNKLKSLLESALSYIHEGFLVFPVEPGEKYPLGAKGKGSPYEDHPERPIHGFKDAVGGPERKDKKRAEKQIRKWWSLWPDANIGLRPPPGVVVVDVDPRDGGEETIARFEVNIGKTLRAWSGGTDKGHHSFFKNAPHDLPGQIGPGVQFKANGTGYVVAPPSVHPSGREYKWANGGFDPGLIQDWPAGLEGPQKAPQAAQGGRSGNGAGDRMGLTPGQLNRVLAGIGADDYHQWIKVGQILRAEYDDEGFDIWVEWSKKSKLKFKSIGDCKHKWRTFKSGTGGGGVGIGTLVHMAGGRVPAPAPEEEFAEADDEDILEGKRVEKTKSKEKHKQIKPTLELNFQILEDIVEKPVQWLVPKYFAKGMLHCIAGYGGEGKSAVTTAFVKAITTGTHLVTGEPLAGGPSSVLIATEEHLASIMKPRMRIAGVDMKRVLVITDVIESLKVGPENKDKGKENEEKTEFWNLVDHLAPVKKLLAKFPEVRTMIVDPIGNYMTGKATKSVMSGNPDVEVRNVLRHWQKLAEELDMVFIFLAHFNKGKTSRVAEKVMGSVAFTTTTRRSYLVGKPGAEWLQKFGYEPPTQENTYDRTIHCMKSNIGRNPAPIVFGVDPYDHIEPDTESPLVYVKGVLPAGLEDELGALLTGEMKKPQEKEGTLKDKILEVVENAPGINSGDLAVEVKVSTTNLSPVLKELESEEKISRVRNGRESWIYPFQHPTLDLLQ